MIRRFCSKEQSTEDNKPKETIVHQTTEEIWKIIHSWDYQWENFNKVILELESFLFRILKLDTDLQELECETISGAMNSPIFPLGKILRLDDDILENQVTRVSVDSLRRYYILNALDEILKISSVEEFWDRNYKIWDIEITSYADLEQNREELKKLHDRFENYEIPWFKEAVKYAAENKIATNFYW